MKSTYFTLIDDELRPLVQSIEAHIGSEIIIDIDDSRINKLACEVDKCGAKILIPESGFFPNESVFHELLHISRFCLYETPRIVVCESYNDWTPELETGFTSLDNSIEHFIIVPEECIQFRNRISYWKDKTNNAIDIFYTLRVTNDDRERLALIHWAFSKHVIQDAELTKKADALVEELKIKDRTVPFLDEITQYLDEKEKLVKVFFKHLRLPLEAGCLEYLDCKNTQSHEKPLTEVCL